MMPAGTYYIGDLCYVMHSEWDEFCSLTITNQECLDGEFTLKDGRRFATYSTAYGDGCYRASNGSALIVDAGLIGYILLSDIDLTDPSNDPSHGTIVTFTHDFVTMSVEGFISFGNVKTLLTIDTGDTGDTGGADDADDADD